MGPELKMKAKQIIQIVLRICVWKKDFVFNFVKSLADPTKRLQSSS